MSFAHSSSRNSSNRITPTSTSLIKEYTPDRSAVDREPIDSIVRVTVLDGDDVVLDSITSLLHDSSHVMIKGIVALVLDGDNVVLNGVARSGEGSRLGKRKVINYTQLSFMERCRLTSATGAAQELAKRLPIKIAVAEKCMVVRIEICCFAELVMLMMIGKLFDFLDTFRSGERSYNRIPKGAFIQRSVHVTN
jgi:hypothetical protein